MAMVDMSDNSNKMGTDMGRIQDAYQGFAKQNYTMLDNLKLGYGGTKTEMQRLLTDATKLTGKKYDISNLNDVYSAIHVIQGELGITGTTAKEASSTFTGSFNSMKSAAKNVLGNLALGKDIKPSLTALASSTSTFLFNNFFPMIGNILKQLPKLLVTTIETLYPIIAEKFTSWADSISKTGAGDLANKFLAGLKKHLPIILKAFGKLHLAIIKLFGALALKMIQVGWNIMKKLALGIWKGIAKPFIAAKKTGNKIANTIKGIGPKIIVIGSMLMLKLASGIRKGLGKVWSAAKAIASKLVAPITAAKNKIKSIIDKIKSFFSKLKLKIPKISLPHLPKLTVTWGSSKKVGLKYRYHI